MYKFWNKMFSDDKMKHTHTLYNIEIKEYKFN